MQPIFINIIFVIVIIILLGGLCFFVSLLIQRYNYGEIVITLLEKNQSKLIKDFNNVIIFINGKDKGKPTHNPLIFKRLKNGEYEILVKYDDGKFSKKEIELEKIAFIELEIFVKVK